MLCRALLALASIRHKWKAPGASRACALRSLPALATKWKAPTFRVDACKIASDFYDLSL